MDRATLSSGILLIVFSAAIAAVALSLVQPPDAGGPDGPSQGDRSYCTPESREAEACFELYQPVCGWYDPDQVQCVRHPCAMTFSNSCFACMDEQVLYWTEGECPP